MKFATINEAARIFDIGRGVIRRGVQAGRYPHMLVGAHVVVDIDELGPILEQEQIKKSLINTTVLSEKTGLSLSKIRCGINEGWIPCQKDGRHYRFNLEEVEEALRKRVMKCTGDANPYCLLADVDE